MKLLENKSEGDEDVDRFETDWYRRMAAKATPGGNLRAYRENRRLTQEQLARKLGGGMLKQHVSGMERGQRPISNEQALRRPRRTAGYPAAGRGPGRRGRHGSREDRAGELAGIQIPGAVVLQWS